VPVIESVRSTGWTAKKQRTIKPVYVHLILDRRDAWPRQFLASVEPTASVPLDLV
jgi:bisphosphoglycerate-independent phosphoglycerate mutase (AlkP superfamily)